MSYGKVYVNGKCVGEIKEILPYTPVDREKVYILTGDLLEYVPGILEAKYDLDQNGNVQDPA